MLPDPFIKWVTETWQHIDVAVFAYLMSFFMAILRTKHSDGKADYIEAMMCGLFSVGVWSCLELLKTPQSVAVGIASAIGYFGTHWFSGFVKDRLDKRGK